MIEKIICKLTSILKVPELNPELQRETHKSQEHTIENPKNVNFLPNRSLPNTLMCGWLKYFRFKQIVCVSSPISVVNAYKPIKMPSPSKVLVFAETLLAFHYFCIRFLYHTPLCWQFEQSRRFIFPECFSFREWDYGSKWLQLLVIWIQNSKKLFLSLSQVQVALMKFKTFLPDLKIPHGYVFHFHPSIYITRSHSSILFAELEV